jgi:hypothetical protein
MTAHRANRDQNKLRGWAVRRMAVFSSMFVPVVLRPFAGSFARWDSRIPGFSLWECCSFYNGGAKIDRFFV